MSVCEDQALVCTQEVGRPLCGVIAYVDVRSGTNSSINTSQAISDSLLDLGATIAPRLTKDVTHVVFKDGKINIERLNCRNVFLVNPLWVDACKHYQEQISESKYPVLGQDEHSTPLVLGRIKRMRSMQPKPFDEQVARSLEKRRKKLRLEHEDCGEKAKFDLDCEFETCNFDSDESSPSDLVSGPGFQCITSFNKPSDPKPTNSVACNKDHHMKHQGKAKTASLAIGSKIPPASKASATGKQLLLKKSKKRISQSKLMTTAQDFGNMEEDKENKHKPTKRDLNLACTRRGSRRSFEPMKGSLVLTSVSSADQETVYTIVRKLGGFDTSCTVQESTTHVVCGATRRTCNVLAATAKGCWLLSLDWVWKSLEAGKWLPEEPFEMASDFPAAQFFRLERQQAGLLSRPTMFHKSGSIFISRNTSPSPQQLEQILTFAGAKLTSSRRKADVYVGAGGPPNATVVYESWVIDSISEHKVLPLEGYLVPSSSSGL